MRFKKFWENFVIIQDTFGRQARQLLGIGSGLEFPENVITGLYLQFNGPSRDCLFLGIWSIRFCISLVSGILGNSRCFIWFHYLFLFLLEVLFKRLNRFNHTSSTRPVDSITISMEKRIDSITNRVAWKMNSMSSIDFGGEVNRFTNDPIEQVCLQVCVRRLQQRPKTSWMPLF